MEEQLDQLSAWIADLTEERETASEQDRQTIDRQIKQLRQVINRLTGRREAWPEVAD